MDIVLAYLARAKDWIFTLEGFLLIVVLGSFAWGVYQGTKILRKALKTQHQDSENRIKEMERKIRQLHLAFSLERLECRENALKDSRFNSSLLAVASKYQVLVSMMAGDQRNLPPEAADMKTELMQLRQKMHDETNLRAGRVIQAQQEVKMRLQEQGD